MATEKRPFKMHPRLLRDVIERQAGTLSKAALEGVMNGVDAGATEMHVTLTTDRLRIVDNGCGFTTRDEIENFDTFGKPHEEGDATYGRFRMGRGQMMAFGHNLWRSGPFLMDVDIRAQSGDTLEYDLQDGLPAVKGCDIDIKLYAPLSQRDVHAMSQEIEQFVRWVAMPVYLNGVRISNDPAMQKAYWDSIGDDGYVKLTATGPLQVFNRGVFVREYPNSTFGTGGTFVSIPRLDVNFARNDVQSTCPVWRRVKRTVDGRAKETVMRKPTLTDDERLNIIARLRSKEMRPSEVYSTRLLRDVSGHPWSPQSIASAGFSSFSVARRGDRVADKLIQSGTTLVLDEELVAAFGVKNLTRLFADYDMFGGKTAPAFKPFKEAAAGYDGSCTPLPRHKWTPTERVWVAVLQVVARELVSTYGYGAIPAAKRDIDVRIGNSTTAEAWTDGRTYVCFAREFLARQKYEKHGAPYFRDLFRVALTMLHELMHDDDSQSCGTHTPEFYRGYHDAADRVPHAVTQASGYLQPARLKSLTDAVTREWKLDQKRAGTGRGRATREQIEREAAEAAAQVAALIAEAEEEQNALPLAAKAVTVTVDATPAVQVVDVAPQGFAWLRKPSTRPAEATGPGAVVPCNGCDQPMKTTAWNYDKKYWACRKCQAAYRAQRAAAKKELPAATEA